MTIHLAAVQALRRAVARAAQVQMRPAMRKRQHLGNSKIQQAYFIVRADLNIRWLNIAMHHRPALAIDIGLERMQVVQLAQYLDPELGRARRFDTLFLFQNLRDGPAFDVLHGDEKTSIQLAKLVKLDDARISLVQLFLDFRPAALRLHDQQRHGIGRFLNNF